MNMADPQDPTATPTAMPQWILDRRIKPDSYLNVFRDGCSDDPYYQDKSEERAGLPPVGRCGNLLRSSPSRFLDSIMSLYAARVPQGTNRELWQHVAALKLFLSAMRDEDSVPSADCPINPATRRLIDSGLYNVVLQLLSANDLFGEHPRYIDCMLNIVREICDMATAEARRSKDYDASAGDTGLQRVSIDSKVAAILSRLFTLAWNHRDVFDEVHINTVCVRWSAEEARICMWEICCNTQWSLVMNNSHFDASGFESMQRILLFFWMDYPDLSRSLKSDILFCILGETFFIVNRHQLVLEKAAAFIENELCAQYDPEEILERLADTLQSSASKDSLLINVMTRITWFVRSMLIQPFFRTYIGPSRIFETLGDSIHTYTVNHNDPEVSWRAWRDALVIVRVITEDAPFSEGAEGFIRQGVVQVLARAILNAAKCDLGNNETGWAVCHEVMNQYTKIGGALQLRSDKTHGEKKQSLPNLFKRAVHDEWYPTLEALRACPPSAAQSDLLEGWQAFGEALGLIESDEQATYEREKKQLCSWHACKYHTQKAPSATRQCAGCGQVRYCSKLCQHNDWKEGKHKDACKRLKGVPHVPRAN